MFSDMQKVITVLMWYPIMRNQIKNPNRINLGYDDAKRNLEKGNEGNKQGLCHIIFTKQN